MKVLQNVTPMRWQGGAEPRLGSGLALRPKAHHLDTRCTTSQNENAPRDVLGFQYDHRTTSQWALGMEGVVRAQVSRG